MQLHLVFATCPYKQFRSRCKNFLRYQLLVLERSHRNVRPGLQITDRILWVWLCVSGLVGARLC
ncbi:MAG: hypothetical protein DMG73_15845 [Acidobacteria bacterium]|nr:MAG: hypothetical protein DMG73_15845 [Acidobacteriota bacterium]